MKWKTDAESTSLLGTSQKKTHPEVVIFLFLKKVLFLHAGPVKGRKKWLKGKPCAGEYWIDAPEDLYLSPNVVKRL